MIWTCAPATTAPVTSCTVPLMAPVAPPWPQASAARRIVSPVKTAREFNFDIHGPLGHSSQHLVLSLSWFQDSRKEDRLRFLTVILSYRCPPSAYTSPRVIPMTITPVFRSKLGGSLLENNTCCKSPTWCWEASCVNCAGSLSAQLTKTFLCSYNPL